MSKGIAMNCKTEQVFGGITYYDDNIILDWDEESFAEQQEELNLHAVTDGRK